MKIKEGFVLRSIRDDHVVVGEGLAQINFNKMLSLNESAAWLWEQVQGKEFTPAILADLLVERYEVTWEQALADAKKLTQSWINEGVAE